MQINRTLEESLNTDGTVELLELFAVATVQLLYFRKCPCDVISIDGSISNSLDHKIKVGNSSNGCRYCFQTRNRIDLKLRHNIDHVDAGFWM